jgi:hypothetical protein
VFDLRASRVSCTVARERCDAIGRGITQGEFATRRAPANVHVSHVTNGRSTFAGAPCNGLLRSLSASLADLAVELERQSSNGRAQAQPALPSASKQREKSNRPDAQGCKRCVTAV